jgi:hypothetical protein
VLTEEGDGSGRSTDPSERNTVGAKGPGRALGAGERKVVVNGDVWPPTSLSEVLETGDGAFFVP